MILPKDCIKWNSEKGTYEYVTPKEKEKGNSDGQIIFTIIFVALVVLIGKSAAGMFLCIMAIAIPAYFGWIVSKIFNEVSGAVTFIVLLGLIIYAVVK